MVEQISTFRSGPFVVVAERRWTRFGKTLPEIELSDMSSDTVIGALNRMLAIHCQSVPIYLSQTSPWSAGSNGRAKDALEHLVNDQRWLMRRLARYIDRLGGSPDPGHPRDLTWMNDLSLDFLVQRVIDSQREDILVIEDCIQRLATDAEARALAQEALGIAKGHLETLEEIARGDESASAGDGGSDT